MKDFLKRTETAADSVIRCVSQLIPVGAVIFCLLDSALAIDEDELLKACEVYLEENESGRWETETEFYRAIVSNPESYRQYLSRAANGGSLSEIVFHTLIENLPYVTEGNDDYTLTFYHFRRWKEIASLLSKALLCIPDEEFESLVEAEDEFDLDQNFFDSLAALGLDKSIVSVGERGLGLLQADTIGGQVLRMQLVQSLDRDSLVNRDALPAFPDAMNFERRQAVYEQLSLSHFVRVQYENEKAVFKNDPRYSEGPPNYPASIAYNLGDLEAADRGLREHLNFTTPFFDDEGQQEMLVDSTRRYIPLEILQSDTYRSISERESALEFGYGFESVSPVSQTGISPLGKEALIDDFELDDDLLVFRFVAEVQFRAYDFREYPIVESCPEAFGDLDKDAIVSEFNDALDQKSDSVSDLDDIFSLLSGFSTMDLPGTSDLVTIERFAELSLQSDHADIRQRAVDALIEFVESTGTNWNDFEWWNHDLPLEITALVASTVDESKLASAIPEIGVDVLAGRPYHQDFARIALAIGEASDSIPEVKKKQYLQIVERIAEIDLTYQGDELYANRSYRLSGDQLIEYAIGAAISMGEAERAAAMSYHSKNYVQERRVFFEAAMGRIERGGGSEGAMVQKFRELSQISNDPDELPPFELSQFLAAAATVTHLVRGTLGGDEHWPDFSKPIGSMLEPDVGAVDFFVSAELVRGRGVVRKLYGAVYNGSKVVSVQEVGEVHELTRMALNYRETLLDNQPVAGLEGEIAERFGPLVEKVKMKRVLILSPTDVINVIPIDRILASRFEGEIRFQVNLRKGHLIGDTVSLEQSDVLLVGNPLYSDSLPLAQIVAEQESGNLSRRSGLPLPNLWVTPLPGALQEVRDLQIFLTEELGGSSEIVVHTLGDATERAFLETCGGKTIIHLATHGLAAPRWGWGSDTAFQDVALAFAGAETTGKLWGLGIYPPGDENGFLDSHEIASGDFSRCELVILSACDTTHGTTPNFSALQGIPLALSAAGVKRAVVTRWCVDDQYTSGFMTRFYERLFASSEGSSIERVWDEHIAAEEARFDDLTRRRKLVAPFALITLN